MPTAFDEPAEASPESMSSLGDAVMAQAFETAAQSAQDTLSKIWLPRIEEARGVFVAAVDTWEAAEKHRREVAHQRTQSVVAAAREGRHESLDLAFRPLVEQAELEATAAHRKYVDARDRLQEVFRGYDSAIATSLAMSANRIARAQLDLGIAAQKSADAQTALAVRSHELTAASVEVAKGQLELARQQKAAGDTALRFNYLVGTFVIVAGIAAYLAARAADRQVAAAEEQTRIAREALEVSKSQQAGLPLPPAPASSGGPRL